MPHFHLAPYDRGAAVSYAAQWARRRNPAFADFTAMGGDCANFVSQCLFAGCGRMDRRKDVGWYYRNLSDRAPAWSGAQFLRRYLLAEKSVGLAARACAQEELLPGDVIFLDSGGRAYHCLLVLTEAPKIAVAAHSSDSWQRPLDTYSGAALRPVRILGWLKGDDEA